MTDSRRAPRTDHSSHDTHLIAASVDRTADERTRAAAERQIAECAACAALFADLRAISSSLEALPRSLPVSRDFRLTAEQASSLRARGWRAFLAGFRGGPSIRPLASALTTLGVAGLVLTVALPNFGLFGGGAGGALAPAMETAGRAVDSNVPAPQGPATGYGKGNPSGVPADYGTGGAGAAASPVAVLGGPAATGSEQAAGGGAGETTPDSIGHQARDHEPTPFSPVALLPWASIVLLLVGVGLLFVTRNGARDRSS